MAKLGRAKKQYKLGTGKVTPKQIAFIVDCYLSDNSYSATLASFRTEASDLLSKTYGKEVPKGLMGLADILNDYIRLKEQRLAADHEKMRVDAAMKRMQEAIRLYHSESVESVSDFLATHPPPSTVPLFCSSNPRNGSQPDNMNHGFSINNLKPPLPPPNVSDARFPAPAHTQSYAEKRKSSKLKEPSPPKKLRTQSPRVSGIVEGIGSSSREACTANVKSPAVLKSNDNSIIQPPVKGLSVVKKLFKHPESYEPNTSPKTPPLPLVSQMDESVSPLVNSAIEAVETSCSLISSETIIISPLKNKGYYAVERSYQVTCSPLKTCAMRLGKRENVKGRLDFDKVDASKSKETPCTVVDASTSSPSDVEASGGLDFDIPDFEIFDGDFLSGLLVDFDQNEVFSGCNSDDNCIITG